MPALQSAPARRRRWRRLLLLAGGLGAVALAFAIWALLPGGRASIDRWELAHGFHRFESAPSIFRALLSVPGRALAGSDAPRLELQLKPKHLRKLQELRQVALQKGLIEEPEQEQVPAVVVFDGAEHDARVRLKGDYTDHLQGNKWSFRVELEDGRFLGMRRFSIQDPATKGFQGEVLYFAMLRQLGVLAPRYDFARVRVAGVDVGVMAVEEHVDAELLLSQGRPDGAVVHFDETLVFHGQQDYRQATVLVFGEKRLQADAALAAAAAAATRKLRAFVDAVEPAATVFDVDRLGGFLATATLLGSWHSMRWHNLRFAYDAAQQRLEPIGFDGNLQMRRPLPSMVAGQEDPTMRMLHDDAVFAAFERRLRQLCADILDGDLVARLQAAEAPALRRLQREYWLLEAFPVHELRDRARHFAAMTALELRALCKVGVGPLAVGAWLQDVDGGVELQLQNRSDVAARVLHIAWTRQDGGEGGRAFAARPPCVLPIALPAGMQAPVVVAAPASGDPEFLDAIFELDLGGSRSWQRAVRNPPPSWPTAR